MVSEVWANRRCQEELAASLPGHPARAFGEAVEAEGMVVEAAKELRRQEQQSAEAQIALARAQARKADQETKLVALQCVALAQQLCSQAFQMKSVNPWPKRLLTQRCYRPEAGTVAFDAHELWARGLGGPYSNESPTRGSRGAADLLPRYTKPPRSASDVRSPIMSDTTSRTKPAIDF